MLIVVTRIFRVEANISMEISQFKQVFENRLQEWITYKRTHIISLSVSSSLQALLLHGLDLIKSDGKRIRPYMTYLTYQMHGGQDQSVILQLGLVLELLHVFCLVHDDWMDHGTERRGVQTAQYFMKAYLASQKRIGDLDHAANSQAVLLGDLIFGWVYQELDHLPSNEYLKCYFHTLIDDVVLGQMTDIDVTTCPETTMTILKQKMLLKTASYTFIRPLQLGAVLAGAGPDVLAFYEQLGTDLGLAFQIQDDLLDILLTEESTHKTSFSDIMSHQHTICTQYVMDHGSKEHQAILQYFWGKPQLSSEDKKELKEMFIGCGSVAFAKKEMNTYFDRAVDAMIAQQSQSKLKDTMLGLIHWLRNRISL